MLFSRVCGALLIAAALTPVSAATAQGPASAAAISGEAADASGAPIAGASIVIRNSDTGQQWRVLTDRRGRFRVFALQPGKYDVTASAPGFAPAAAAVSLALGEVLDLPLTLTVASVSESVRVSASVDVADVTRTQTAESVSPAEIQQLPLNGRNYLDLALLTPGVSRTNTGASQRFAETSAVPGTGISVSAQRNLNNAFIVDGLSANDDAAGLAGTFFSQEVIREFQIISSGSVAEFGRASSGIVNIVTQSGTNQYRGGAYAFFRNDRLDGRNPLLPRKDPLSQRQVGATVGGPLRRERTFFFSNVERTDNDATGAITISESTVQRVNAALARVGLDRSHMATGEYSTGFHTTNVFGRVDHQAWTATRIAMRYSLYDVGSSNARNVGGLNAESRGSALDDRDQTVAVAASTVAGAGWLNEARVQATRSRLTAPVNDLPGPAINIAGAANFGTGTFSPTARALDLFQGTETLTAARDTHVIKAGVDVLYNRVRIDFPGPVQGVYTFASMADFEQGRYITFQQAFGAPSQFQSNPNFGAFIDDQWRPADAVTLSAGLRYDVQWLPQPIVTDTNNVSPRIGLAWAPGNRRTIVRANAGIYFDRVPLRATSNALQRDGSKYVVAVLRPADAAAPRFPAVLDAFPPGLLTSITTIDSHVQSGASRQAGVSLERQLGSRSSISFGYQHVSGTGLLMSRNVNTPPNRPDPRFLNVSRYESIGESQYDALMLSVRARRNSFDGRASYTLSRGWDDAGNFFFSQPQDAGDVRADWGPSDNDQRHRLTLSGTWQTRGWQLAGVFSAATALPFNVLTGTDRNGDTNVNDRPPGVGRNSARGFGFASLDLRVSRTVAVSHARIELTLDAFNALNRTNFSLPNNIYGAGVTPLQSFGRPTAALDPRQIQLGARVSF